MSQYPSKKVNRVAAIWLFLHVHACLQLRLHKPRHLPRVPRDMKFKEIRFRQAGGVRIPHHHVMRSYLRCWPIQPESAHQAHLWPGQAAVWGFNSARPPKTQTQNDFVWKRRRRCSATHEHAFFLDDDDDDGILSKQEGPPGGILQFARGDLVQFFYYLIVNIFIF